MIGRFSGLYSCQTFRDLSLSVLDFYNFSPSVYDSCLGHKSQGKNLVRNFQYGPRTKLVRGITLLLQEAWDNLFRPAPAIVNEVLLEEWIDENPCPSLPKPENMARAANRLRQQLRPEAVRRFTLDFERALWTVLRQLLPDVSLQGCLFHWMQAL